MAQGIDRSGDHAPSISVLPGMLRRFLSRGLATYRRSTGQGISKTIIVASLVCYEPSLRTLRELHEPPRLFEEGRCGLRPVGAGRLATRRRPAGRGAVPQLSSLHSPLANGSAPAAIRGPSQVGHLA